VINGYFVDASLSYVEPSQLSILSTRRKPVLNELNSVVRKFNRLSRSYIPKVYTPVKLMFQKF
jgi:hypothetical protein